MFESSKEVGDMVRRLPKVGVGPHFDLPQARYVMQISGHMTDLWACLQSDVVGVSPAAVQEVHHDVKVGKKRDIKF